MPASSTRVVSMVKISTHNGMDSKLYRFNSRSCQLVNVLAAFRLKPASSRFLGGAVARVRLIVSSYGLVG